MYIKLNDYHKYHWKNVCTVIYIVVFTILCCISGGYTVRDIVNNAKWNVKILFLNLYFLIFGVFDFLILNYFNISFF